MITRQAISTIRQALLPQRLSQIQVVWTIRIGVTLAVVIAILVLVHIYGLVSSDNAAVVGAVLALVGVLIAQVVNTNIAWSAQVTQQEVEAQRAQADALRDYLEQMGKLLIERHLRTSKPNAEVRTLARSQTLAGLEGLDTTRKRILLQFLYESELISKEQPLVSLSGANLRETFLRGADLRDANLSRADLSGVVLSRSYLRNAYLRDALLRHADLRGANLNGAKLRNAILRGANLNSTILTNAYLRGADLRGADLSEADLSGGTNLSEADIRGANLDGVNLHGGSLRGANLRGANLRAANLSDADLSSATITKEQLGECKSVAGATMPDWATYD